MGRESFREIEIIEEDKTMGYQIFTDATADLNEDMLFGLPNVEIIPMEIFVGGYLLG